MKRVQKPLPNAQEAREPNIMELKFPQLQALLDQRISRRQALSTGAKAAIGVGAVVVVAGAGYLAYTSLGSSTTSSTTTPTTTTTSSTASSIASSTTSATTTSSTASSIASST